MIDFDIIKTLKGRKEKPFVIDVKVHLNDASKVLALKGESGSGKTSVLRMIAGLLTPDSGKITINNETWFDSSQKLNIPVQKRQVGFVFQDYALFPHMTVKKNLAFAGGSSVSENDIDHYLNMTSLQDYGNHFPSSLSAGQRQRVAIARALIRKPSLLLLDEPLSALDEETRERMQETLKNIFTSLQIPVVLVSHSMSEVARLSDQVVVINAGKLTK